MAPGMPLEPGVSTISAPKANSSTRRSRLGPCGLGHGDDQPVSLDNGNKRQRNTRIAAGRFDQYSLSGLDRARFLAGLNHRQADTVFHAAEWVLALQLCHNGCWQSGRHSVQSHQWGATNDLSYICGNACHENLLFPGFRLEFVATLGLDRKS